MNLAIIRNIVNVKDKNKTKVIDPNADDELIEKFNE